MSRRSVGPGGTAKGITQIGLSSEPHHSETLGEIEHFFRFLLHLVGSGDTEQFSFYVAWLNDIFALCFVCTVHHTHAFF